MLKEHDFSESIPNPYFERLSKEITFRVDLDSLAYFHKLGEPYGMVAEAMISGTCGTWPVPATRLTSVC